MNFRLIAAEVVSRLGQSLGQQNLELSDETDRCILALDDSLVIDIEYEKTDERLIFTAFVGTLPSGNIGSLLRNLMGANLYWHQTGGATLCLEEATNGVVLIHSASVAELGIERCASIVENLLNQAERWRAGIARFQLGNMHSADQPSKNLRLISG